MLKGTSANVGADGVSTDDASKCNNGTDDADKCIGTDKWKAGHRGWVLSWLSLRVGYFDIVCRVVVSDGNDGCIKLPKNIEACGSGEKGSFAVFG